MASTSASAPDRPPDTLDGGGQGVQPVPATVAGPRSAVRSGSKTTALGAQVGLPARPFVRVCRSVMVNSPDSTPGEYVVGHGDVDERGPVEHAAPRHPRLLLGEEGDGLAAVDDRTATEGHDPVGTLALDGRMGGTDGVDGQVGLHAGERGHQRPPDQPGQQRAVVARGATGARDEHHPSQAELPQHRRQVGQRARAEAQALGDVVLAPRSRAHVSILAVSG